MMYAWAIDHAADSQSITCTTTSEYIIWKYRKVKTI